MSQAGWAWLLARHPASRVAPLSLLVPVFGMSLSALLLGERFAGQDLVAAALILSGLFVSMMPGRPRLGVFQPES